MICACIGLYGERVDQALVGIKWLRPHTDRYVVVVDKTVTETQKKTLVAAGCEVYFHPWTDSMVNMRNQYLNKVQTDDWVIVHDPDEHFNEQFCNDVRNILKRAEEQDIDLLLINSHDIDIDKDGKRNERVSDFFKNLIYRKREGTHYEGVGEVKEVHETLIIPGTMKQVRLDPKKYWYTHEKYFWEVWERAARNIFMAGGGNNAGTRNPSWKPLREICENIGLTDWTKTRDYFRKGNIDPQLKKWLWDNRSEGFDYDHEEMEFGRWYFEYLHPEEAEGWKPITEIPKGHPAEVMRFVEECYMTVFGRHADQPGKEAYTKAILEGKIRREDLPEILRRSLEYQEKVGGLESVRVQVPINVDVRMSESIILDALRRSKTYWEKIGPKLKLASKWENLLNIARKAETEGKGVDVSPAEAFAPFVKTFREYASPDRYPNILDIGAGCGAETSVLVKEGYKVTGITFGADNIKYAKEKFGIDLIEMDMHNLQLPDGFFDGAFGVQTFEHAFSAWLLVLELRRVLRDGGMVFIDVPDPDDEAMYTIWHTNLLYPRQIKHLFKLAGFKEVVDLSQKHRLAFLFEKLPDNSWPEWGYVRFILKPPEVIKET